MGTMYNWIEIYNRLFELINKTDPNVYHSGSRFIDTVREVEHYHPDYSQYMEKMRSTGLMKSRKVYYYEILMALEEEKRIQVVNKLLDRVEPYEPEKTLAIRNLLGVRPEPADKAQGGDNRLLSTNIRPLKVFLCHSSGDKPTVRELYQRLRSDKLDPWLDEEKLLPGQEWSQEIIRAVRGSDVVIVCLSRGSINKTGYVQKEIKYALDSAEEQPDNSIFLIPLRLEECEIPERLRHLHWVNYYDGDGYKRLMEALRNRAQNLDAKEPLDLRLSQVLKKYEGRRIKAKGIDRKEQFFVLNGELHYMEIGAAEVCEKHGLPYLVLDNDEEFILVQAQKGDDLNALQMATVLSKSFSRGGPAATTVSILFLAADPADATRLRLGEEVREIQEKIQLAKLRDQFKLNFRLSARPADVSQALLDLAPQVVHFSGHGTRDALVFEDIQGNAHLVSASALGALFEHFSDQVRCVILNACYSEAQAQAIAAHVDYVVGTTQAIGDKAAIAFSVGFYQALGAGRSIEDAYKLGCVQIRLQGIAEHSTPILIKRRDDPKALKPVNSALTRNYNFDDIRTWPHKKPCPKCGGQMNLNHDTADYVCEKCDYWE